MAHIRREPDIRVLIITGEGEHFCSGGDLRNMASLSLDNTGWHQRMQDLHHGLTDLLTLDRPVIAAVDGAAAGAGFSLALMADFVLATHRAHFCMSFMKIGLVPDCGAFFTLPRAVGIQKARELMLSARDVSAAEAMQLGIVMELHEPETLMARARHMAASLALASPTATSLIKRTLSSSSHHLSALLDMEAAGQALAAGTQYHQQAVQRFLNKTPPLFQWPIKAIQ